MMRSEVFRLFAAGLLAWCGSGCGDDGGPGPGGGGGGGSGAGGAATTTSSSTATSAGGAGGDGGSTAEGGGGAGGGVLTCTGDDPPPTGCGSMGGGEGAECTVEVDGGCPTTTVTWRCVNGEGGPGWLRLSDSHCTCDGPDEAACSAIPGCGWAVPDPSCDPEVFTLPGIDAEGCFKLGCGTSSFGRVGDACRLDLCPGG